MTAVSTSRWLVLAECIWFLVSGPYVAGAQDKSLSHQEYVAASRLGSEYTMALYNALVSRLRSSEILKKCGYKKESDELDQNTRTAVKKKLDQLINDSIKADKVKDLSIILIARESAASTWLGYRLGYKEAFTFTSDLLPARAYEEVRKTALQEAKNVLNEDAAR